MLNITALTHDGRTITDQVNTHKEAFTRLANWSRDTFWNGGKPLARFFIGSNEGVMEYTESEVKSEARRP